MWGNGVGCSKKAGQRVIRRRLLYKRIIGTVHVGNFRAPCIQFRTCSSASLISQRFWSATFWRTKYVLQGSERLGGDLSRRRHKKPDPTTWLVPQFAWRLYGVVVWCRCQHVLVSAHVCCMSCIQPTALAPCFSETYFNIIVSSTSRYSKWSRLFRFTLKNIAWFHRACCVLHPQPLSGWF